MKKMTQLSIQGLFVFSAVSASLIAQADNRSTYKGSNGVYWGVTLGQGVGGGALIYQTLIKKHPEVKAAYDKFKAAEHKFGRAMSDLERAQKIVSPQDKARQVAAAQKAVDAAWKEVENTKGIKAAKDFMKGLYVGKGAIDDGIGGAMKNSWEGDVVDGMIDDPHEQALRRHRSAKYGLERANSLEAASETRKAQKVAAGQAALQEADLNKGKLRAALNEAKKTYGPKGWQKVFKYVGAIAGGYLLLEAGTQMVVFFNPQARKLFPIAQWALSGPEVEEYIEEDDFYNPGHFRRLGH